MCMTEELFVDRTSDELADDTTYKAGTSWERVKTSLYRVVAADSVSLVYQTE